ncbi:MAG: DUF6442 family protein [Zhenhengia sp.]
MVEKQQLGQVKTKEIYDMAESKSSILGMKGVLTTGFCLWIANFLKGNDSESILLILLTGITVSYWVKYRTLREKSDLIWFIAGAVAWSGTFVTWVLTMIS